MIYCPNCNTANRDSSRFCNECGANLQKANRRCQACGEMNSLDKTNCTNCGARLILLAEAEPPELPEEEGPVFPTSLPEAARPSVASETDIAQHGGAAGSTMHSDGVIRRVESPADAPGWLQEIRAHAQETQDVETQDVETQDIASLPASTADEAAGSGLPDWLREARPGQFDTSPARETPRETPAEPAATAATPTSQEELPSWLSQLGTGAAPEVSTAGAQADAGGELPAELPAWLSDLSATTTPTGRAEAQPSETPAWLSELSQAAPPTPAAAGMPSDVAMEDLEEWLRPDSMPKQPSPPEGMPPAPPPTAEPQLEGLTLGEIPSWVQSLRPGAIPTMSGEALETSGLLAGVRGALPAESVMSMPHKLAQASAAVKQIPTTGFTELFAPQPAPPVALPAPPPVKSKPRWSLRIILSLLILLVIIIPFLPLPFISGLRGANIAGYKPASEFYQTINQVNANRPNSVVLVGIDYASGSRGELDPQARAAIFHLLGNKQRIITLSFVPDGGQLAQDALNSRNPASTSYNYPYAYGETHLNAGYQSGGEAAMRSLVQNWLPPTATDFRERKPIGDSTLGKAVKTIKDVDMIIVFSDDGAQIKRWIEQIGKDSGKPLLVGVSAAAGPIAAPYYDNQQIKGLLVGVRGAAEYEGSLAQPGSASALLDGVSYVVIILIVVIVAVLLTMLFRRQRKATA